MNELYNIKQWVKVSTHTAHYKKTVLAIRKQCSLKGKTAPELNPITINVKIVPRPTGLLFVGGGRA